jgi:hypothetical protein
MAQVNEGEPRVTRDGTDEALKATRESRQDRVKARKQRDIESLRSKTSSRTPLSETAPQNNTQAIPSPKIIAPPKNPKRSIVQYQEPARKKGVISLSPIMLVANLAPYTGLVLPTDLPAPRIPGKTSGSSTIRSAEHTPPHSLSSSPSDTEHVRSPRRRLTSARRGEEGRMLSPTGSMLESRRKERRVKRNLRERERELDARLGRIERDNEVLMGVLSGIANGFGELSRRVEKTGLSGVVGMRRGISLAELKNGNKVGEDGRGVEPVMRELQVLAPSVSEERVEHVEDEFDEDDGGSILL